MRLREKQSFTYISFLIPALALFFCFFIVPFFQSLWVSLTDTYGYNKEIHFIGLANYIEAFTTKSFTRSLLVTIKYTLFTTVVTNLVALALALLLDGVSRIKRIFRALFFIPNLMSLIIVSFVWVFLYGDVYRSLFEALHLSDAFYVSWLGNEKNAIFSIGVTAVWQCAGYYMIIYIAALQDIPPELVEAARIDGATNWQIIRAVKLPLIRYVVVINTILLITNGFKTFDIPMAMTSGGPAGATTTIALLIYNSGFRSNRTGYATAQSVILFLIISLLTTALYIFQNKGVDDR